VFTGIVQATGVVTATEMRDGDMRLLLDAQRLALQVEPARLAVGQSIAVNGVCLTVVEFDGRRFAADVSGETLAHTTLARLRAGTAVNLEAALRMGDPLGGHLVSGHVDGVGEVTGTGEQARSVRLTVQAPAALARFIAPKGSVALEGVSLTVNDVDGRQFAVNLIPHTMAHTTFGSLAAGALLNLEVDLLARYVLRALQE
jgi:riboflavin synthase